MSDNKDRGMMKWAPYKSLIEQEDVLRRALSEKRKVEKPIISTDQAEEINAILVDYHEQTLKVTFWRRGYIETIEDKIVKIDPYEKVIKFTSTSIPFDCLLSLEEI